MNKLELKRKGSVISLLFNTTKPLTSFDIAEMLHLKNKEVEKDVESLWRLNILNREKIKVQHQGIEVYHYSAKYFLWEYPTDVRREILKNFLYWNHDLEFKAKDLVLFLGDPNTTRSVHKDMAVLEKNGLVSFRYDVNPESGQKAKFFSWKGDVHRRLLLVEENKKEEVIDVISKKEEVKKESLETHTIRELCDYFEVQTPFSFLQLFTSRQLDFILSFLVENKKEKNKVEDILGG